MVDENSCSYTSTIYDLKHYIETIGFKVDLHAAIGCRSKPFDSTSKKYVSGRTYYDHDEPFQRLVQIDEPCVICAVMTIAHEGGHALHYVQSNKESQPPCEERERRAYRLGWKILKTLSVSFITREMWKEHHELYPRRSHTYRTGRLTPADQGRKG